VRNLLALDSSNLEIIVVIEDPDLDKVENFINPSSCISTTQACNYLTYCRKFFYSYFWTRQRINHIQIQHSQRIILENFKDCEANFDYSVESWVIKQLGKSRNITTSSYLGANFRKETDNFITKITDTLKLKIRQQFVRMLSKYSTLSLLTYVGIKAQYFEEIKLICQWFGEIFSLIKLLK
jgi:hypothetical protein